MNSKPTGNPDPTSATSREVVVIHSSDIHVDDGHTASLFGGDGTLGLRCVLDTAKAASADVVILAGDIFEHNRLAMSILDRTARLLDDVGIPVVILPGNHDPLIPESAYHRGPVADPHNVHVLGVTHDEAVLFPEFELEIWGRAHRDYFDMLPLETARPRGDARWHIAIAHGHYEPEPDMTTTLRPSWLISDADIAATGADYVALGHWNIAVQVGNGTVPAHYSGSPDHAKTVNLVRLGGESGNGGVTVIREPVRWDALKE